MHAAQLRVLVALSGRSGTPVPGLESSVRGLYITLDFRPHVCSAIVEILKDSGGHYLLKKDFSPQSHRGSFNNTAPIGLFPCFQYGTLYKKSLWDI